MSKPLVSKVWTRTFSHPETCFQGFSLQVGRLYDEFSMTGVCSFYVTPTFAYHYTDAVAYRLEKAYERCTDRHATVTWLLRSKHPLRYSRSTQDRFVSAHSANRAHEFQAPDRSQHVLDVPLYYYSTTKYSTQTKPERRKPRRATIMYLGTYGWTLTFRRRGHHLRT